MLLILKDDNIIGIFYPRHLLYVHRMTFKPGGLCTSVQLLYVQMAEQYICVHAYYWVLPAL